MANHPSANKVLIPTVGFEPTFFQRMASVYSDLIVPTLSYVSTIFGPHLVAKRLLPLSTSLELILTRTDRHPCHRLITDFFYCSEQRQSRRAEMSHLV